MRSCDLPSRSAPGMPPCSIECSSRLEESSVVFIGMITMQFSARAGLSMQIAHAQDVDATVRFAVICMKGGRLGEGLEQTGSAIASYVS